MYELTMYVLRITISGYLCRANWSQQVDRLKTFASPLIATLHVLRKYTSEPEFCMQAKDTM